jgi:hypothetical protein
MMKKINVWKLGLAVLAICGLELLDKYIFLYFFGTGWEKVLDVSAFVIGSSLFFLLACGNVSNAKSVFVNFVKAVIQKSRSFLYAFLFLASLLAFVVLIISQFTESISWSFDSLVELVRSPLYGFGLLLNMLGYLELTKNSDNKLLQISLYVLPLTILGFLIKLPLSFIVLGVVYYSAVGFAILGKNEAFATGISLFFYMFFNCDLACACDTFNIAGIIFKVENASGVNQTMSVLFALLVASMAFVAYYFYEYAYAYSLPMKEVVQKTKFAYQRTWGGKPLVIAELLPLLKKNRENIKIWSDAVITHEDYARSRTMSCNESYYGVHGFENGKWHRFDDGLLVHAETTSNREGRFRLNYRWPADRYLIKVIEKEKIYVGIFAVVKTLEEVQSYGKAYNFNAPPNVLSRWTKAPLNFRCQCALLYDISTGEEAYIRYDVIDHPDGFRRNLRGFYGGITLD